MVTHKNIILASASPRRHELLDNAGIVHTVIVADADERSVKFVDGQPGEYVKSIARLKNNAVFTKISAEAQGKGEKLPDSIIISADTVVYHPSLGTPLGKPRDRDDAIRMLSSLSGVRHAVVSGVVIRDMRSGTIVAFSESTDVKFRQLTDGEILSYVDSGEPFDKAGGYGIQGAASIFVSEIHGDFFNVVGLPVCRVYEELARLT